MFDVITFILGWIGAIAFAVCAIPQVIKTYRTKKTDDLSWMFLWLWMIGECAMWTYVIMINIKSGDIQYPMHFNYLFNSISLIYLIGAKSYYERIK